MDTVLGFTRATWDHLFLAAPRPGPAMHCLMSPGWLHPTPLELCPLITLHKCLFIVLQEDGIHVTYTGMVLDRDL